jgi:hypothetical protein
MEILTIAIKTEQVPHQVLQDLRIKVGDFFASIDPIGRYVSIPAREVPPPTLSAMVYNRGVESRPFDAAIAINIGRYVSAAVINTILVIGRRSAIRTDGQSGCDERRDAIGCIRVARGGTRGQSTGR